MRANDCPGWAKFSHRRRCVAQGGEGHEGIYSKTLSEVFRLLEERSEDYEFSASVSMLEIYNEAIYDLLSDSSATQLHAAAMGGGPQKIRIRATGGGKNVISDLSSVEVTSADGAMECVSIGKQNRATACTDSNAHSSRSHCILSFHLRATNVHEGIVTESRLRMIDLAGSERLDRSGGECGNGWFGADCFRGSDGRPLLRTATGQRLEETKSINKSLSALGDVIAALKQKHAHVPYRNSKLTHYLQDSLGKNAKTLMLAQVSPAEDDYDESFCERP